MAMYDEGSAPGQPESRTGAFGSGLAQTGEKFNSQVPRGYMQHSVLQQGLPSANGMSQDDYQRILPGVNNGGRPVILPSDNGTSSGTYEQNTYLRLNGHNVI
jgi:hypothetical protein